MAIRHLLALTGHTLRTLPILVLYLTDGCNSRCATCDIWRSPRRNMQLGLAESLAAEAGALGLRWAVFSGGEAMQHPDWPRIAHAFRAQGARTILLTNGLLLKKQASAVIEGIDEVVVSLDAGSAPTYDAVRGVDAFDLVLEGIQAVRAGGVPVTTRTTLQRANFRELPAIITAAKGAGATGISFLTVDVSNPFAFGPRFDGLAIPVVNEHEPPAAALAHNEVAEFDALLNEVEHTHAPDFASGLMHESPAKLRTMAAYFRALAGEGAFPAVRCNAPHTSAVVEVDGTLRPCYFLPAVGKSANGSGLAGALNTPEAIAMRRAYRAGERPECGRCVCPLYKGPRALVQL
ncbi:MAG TPA: radical SAM/SPASM domain-containing protein [Candidatus Limnocylindrales bacterium]|nr:radical SAM/SPASM domain-containing protein [Candidatus Limnocylindrales bacterium]